MSLLKRQSCCSSNKLTIKPAGRSYIGSFQSYWINQLCWRDTLFNLAYLKTDFRLCNAVYRFSILNCSYNFILTLFFLRFPVDIVLLTISCWHCSSYIFLLSLFSLQFPFVIVLIKIYFWNWSSIYIWNWSFYNLHFQLFLLLHLKLLLLQFPFGIVLLTISF